VTGDSARMRALMNAWYEANDSLTGGSSAASVASSAACSTFLACDGSICLKPSSPRPADTWVQCSSSLSTRDVTQPSLSMPSEL
jgi:hypothetical protein